LTSGFFKDFTSNIYIGIKIYKSADENYVFLIDLLNNNNFYQKISWKNRNYNPFPKG